MAKVYLLLAAIGLLVPAAFAQETDPGYLSQFPSVEQVRTDTPGTDKTEGLAKLVGEYWQLSALVAIMARADHRDEKHYTADEIRINQAYVHAYSVIRASQDDQLGLGTPAQDAWYQLHRRYEEDHELRDDLYGRYFNDEFRTQIYKVLGEKKPEIAAPKTDPKLALTYFTNGRDHTKKADRLYAAKQYADADREYHAAAEAYQKATQADPHNVDALAALCRTYLVALGEFDHALEALKKLYALKPDDDSVVTSIGVTQYSMGKLDDATATFAKVLAKSNAEHGSLATAHQWTGKILNAQKKFDEAIPHLKMALKLKKDDSHIHEDLGLSYFSMKRYRDAIDAYTEAVRLDPDSGSAYGQLVLTYIALGDKTAAAEALTKLKTIDPERYEKLSKQLGSGVYQ